jgi:hypothetical protein
MKTKEEIQKDFQQANNEILGDISRLLDRYYQKRLVAEQEIQEIIKGEEKKEKENKK